jgi:hypothetical protein
VEELEAKFVNHEEVLTERRREASMAQQAKAVAAPADKKGKGRAL